jgi:benzaldehyde dehydrogenase (NAD)
MAAGRHIVDARVVDEFLERLSAKAVALPVGDPYREEVALGPLIDDEQLRRVGEIVDEAVADGAEVRAGGRAAAPFYPPTVLAAVKPRMRAFAEEIFGPVAPVVSFADEEEAVALAVAGNYGLAGAVHSRDLARARRIGAQLPVGMLHINGQTINDSPYIPFGGRGESGNGSRFGSVGNPETFQQLQWVTVRETPDRGGFPR